MRGASGLARLMRDYIESRNGRISWTNHFNLFLEDIGKRKRLKYGNGQQWPDRTENETGRLFTSFKGRAAQCFHPDKWLKILPHLTGGNTRPRFLVPAKQCETCVFNEPSRRFGSRRYSSCRWYRENNAIPTPGELLQSAVNKADAIMKGTPII